MIYLVVVVVATHTHTPTENEPTCNCDHCNNQTVEAKEENENTTSTLLYKEDSDGDGSRTICARDRDFNDRTFPSVCHMLCYNRCLILRLSAVTENDTKKYVAIAYRNNYYKLRDGKC
ncbi:hypothetical protein WN51_13310 [Melipona quadrifasciata]|uniref:Uncharacterized protein n=1 Tax=Melipona quadrifasciata TaxID=166423 RepID=A0A0M9A3S7_9HYME|nr:hypothetical protein WN51_13310 [Melipona quadrifasciata]